MMTWNGWGKERHITNAHVLTTADVCHDERKGETKERWFSGNSDELYIDTPSSREQFFSMKDSRSLAETGLLLITIPKD